MLRASTTCIWSLNEAMSVLDMHDLLLPVDAAKRVGDLLRQSLLHWQYLAGKYFELGVRRWKLRPKHHVLDHFCDEVPRTRINPRLSCSCFQEESFLGHLKRIAVKCSSVRVVERTLQRLLLLLGLRWHHTREYDRELQSRCGLQAEIATMT